MKTVSELLAAMGSTSRAVLGVRVREALSDRRVRQELGLDAADFEDLTAQELKELWRTYVGPRHYHGSVLSIERQVEILSILGRPLQIYRDRKKRELAIRLEKWRSEPTSKRRAILSEFAWDSINTTDSAKGLRLQFGLTNAGCTYWQQDKDGVGCYNCGYFMNCVPAEAFSGLTSDALSACLLDQVKAVLQKHNAYGDPNFDTIDIVGDGSFLNAAEVPKSVQDEVFREVSSLPGVTRLLVEASPEHIHDHRIREILDILRPDQRFEIAVGLESADEFVATFCINKSFLATSRNVGGLLLDGFENLVERMRPYSERCAIQAYVLLKPGLLTEGECIVDAVNTVRWLRSLSHRTGVPLFAKLEPTVVCYGSLLEVLNDARLTREGHVVVSPEDGDPVPGRPIVHEPPSYWSVVEAIAELISDGSDCIVRVGAREDMDVFKAIPAVYDGIRLSGVDSVLYNAVQRFNTHTSKGLPDVIGLLAAIFYARRDSSYDKWRMETSRARPRISTLCDELEPQIREAIRSGRYAPQFRIESALSEISREVNRSEHVREAACRIGERWREGDSRLREDLTVELKKPLLRAMRRVAPWMSERDFEVDQLQYVQNPPPNVRFEMNFDGAPPLTGNETDGFAASRGIDLWAIIPVGEISEDEQMAKDQEIERKWIIDEVPSELLGRANPIKQAYVSISRNEEVRVRRKLARDRSGDDDPYMYLLTVKSAGERTRIEREVEIDKSVFDVLWEASEGKTVLKDRYELDDPEMIPEVNQNGKSYKIELDVYHGKLDRLRTAEVEFRDEDDAQQFVPPEWFGREVTFDRRFKNQSLAAEGWAAIRLHQDVKYQHTVVAMHAIRSDEVASAIEVACGAKLPRLELVSIDRLPRFVGRIRRETARVLWSCAGVLAEEFDGNPSDLALLALARQTQRPVSHTLPRSDDATPPSTSAVITAFFDDLRERLAAPRQPPALTEKPLSEEIANQRFVDNELLSRIETTAQAIHVITTTLEFDLGDLREAVVANLEKGKRYGYYIPYLSPSGTDFPELRANLHSFRELYWNYRDRISVFQLPNSYFPHYHELVIYTSTIGSHPFGYTYLERKTMESELELIELPGELLPLTLDWLGNKCSSSPIWHD